MTKPKCNQSGASSIMLALFFVLIISILTTGYAMLARREQRAVLEKTLSTQSQYTAESGINAVKNYIDKTLAMGVTPISNPNCTPNTSNPVAADYIGPNFSPPNFDSTLSDAKLTCITWDTRPEEVVFDLAKFGGNTSFNNKNNVGYFKITWSTKEATGVYGVNAGDKTKMPNILPGHKSVIKLVTGMRNYIYSSPTMFNVAYLVPTDASTVIPSSTTENNPSPAPPGLSADVAKRYVDLGNSNHGYLSTDNQLGTVYYVPCSGSGECTAYIGGLNCPLLSDGGCGFSVTTPLYRDRMFYLQNLGASGASVSYRSIQDINSMTFSKIENVAVKFDSNAIAGGMSKRLVGYLPTNREAWQPWFTVLSDNLCKDYKVDGVGNSTPVTGVSGCP